MLGKCRQTSRENAFEGGVISQNGNWSARALFSGNRRPHFEVTGIKRAPTWPYSRQQINSHISLLFLLSFYLLCQSYMPSELGQVAIISLMSFWPSFERWANMLLAFLPGRRGCYLLVPRRLRLWTFTTSSWSVPLLGSFIKSSLDISQAIIRRLFNFFFIFSCRGFSIVNKSSYLVNS